MLALLQLLLPKRATKQRVAVLIHPVVEVLAGDADAAALLSLQLPIVNERPLLHADLSLCICTTAGSTTRSRRRGLRRAGGAAPRLCVEEWGRRGRGNPLDFMSQGVTAVLAPNPFFSRPQIALNEA